jgi:hypothetical protein
MTAVTASAQGSDAPAPGQLGTVRNRMWVASDVVEGNVAAGSAVTMTGRPPHVVTLVSIEDDARDERLRVVWELERGAVAHDQHALPDPAHGFDDPALLRFAAMVRCTRCSMSPSPCLSVAHRREGACPSCQRARNSARAWLIRLVKVL